jgi:aminoglycoside phosphotransferase (APT) family kinase protein
VTKRSPYLIAAMASAIAPDLSVVAVHAASNLPETGVRKSIETSVALDSEGAEYDIAVAESKPAGKLLRRRALAAKLLSRTPETRGLGIRLEEAVATGDVEKLPVTITRHLEGTPHEFADLNLEQCAELGTAIATIHLLDADFLLDAAYPRFSAEDIRKDLDKWVIHLKSSPEVPEAIAERWEQLVGIDALWDFTPRTIHGDYFPNDVLFRDNSVRAVRNWEQIQVSDPARDFAWAYNEWISNEQRDALLTAYGRMMGSHMDSRIVPRARLWRQMDIVRGLLQALAAADRDWIRAARQQVEHLASILSPVVAVKHHAAPQTGTRAKAESSTITVGNLLSDAETGAFGDANPAPDAPHSMVPPRPATSPHVSAASLSEPPAPMDGSSTVLSQRTPPRSPAAQTSEPVESSAPSAPYALDAPQESTAAPSAPVTPLSQEIRLKSGYVSLETDEHQPTSTPESRSNMVPTPPKSAAPSSKSQASSENELESRAAETIIIPKAHNENS